MPQPMQRITNMRKSGFLLSFIALALSACGAGDDAFVGGTGGGGVPASPAATLTLITSTPTISSDGAAPAQISAFVRDARNQFMADVPVIFSANSGGLLVTQGRTDVNGLATATLSSAGDPSSRTITVTAIAGNVTATIDVGVAGSILTVQGPNALTAQQQGTYTITLNDAGNRGIPGRAVTVASQRSNALSAASVVTDSSGRATFTMTASNSGNDTITVTGLGLTATQAVAVNSDSFTFVAPTAATEVPLGASQTVTVRLRVNGAVPSPARSVSFSTTRGTVTPTSIMTDGNGDATVTVSANNAGGAIITASSGQSTAQLPLEFIAQTPASIDVQPSAFTIATSQTSTITAVVRDASNNLVKNQTVVFTLDDVTGGTLSVGSAITDSQGRAQTIYTASNTTSANEGVKITATVAGVAPRQVALTVARREVFLSLGTGNELEEPNTAQYKIEYIVQVTDASGNGVANVPVSLRVLSDRYYKGWRVAATPPATGWGTNYSVPGGCQDEDTLTPGGLRNGVLDAGEDFNSSGRLEAGNIASVSPSNAVTDSQGFVLVNVFYPQEYAYYLDVALSASTTVQGTEYVRTSRFRLSGSATDFNSTNNAPPGVVSPFGVGVTCSDPN
jgi:hypothetical protein